MSKPLLNESAIFPSASVLESVLKASYPAYTQLMGQLPLFKAEVQWRYYNDGKAWLGKCTAGKKTVFWLSAWDGFFKLSFYFTEKTRGGVQQLAIDSALKQQLADAPVAGRLIPLFIDVSKTQQLADVMQVIEYKRSLK